jgi:hypothetical protein
MIDTLREKIEGYKVAEIRELSGNPDIERLVQHDKNYIELVKLLNYMRPLAGKSELLLRLFNSLSTKHETLNHQIQVQQDAVMLILGNSKSYLEASIQSVKSLEESELLPLMNQLANFEKELPLLDRIQTQDGRRLAEHLNIRAYMQERDVIAKQVESINENAQSLA